MFNGTGYCKLLSPNKLHNVILALREATLYGILSLSLSLCVLTTIYYLALPSYKSQFVWRNRLWTERSMICPAKYLLWPSGYISVSSWSSSGSSKVKRFSLFWVKLLMWLLGCGPKLKSWTFWSNEWIDRVENFHTKPCVFTRQADVDRWFGFWRSIKFPGGIAGTNLLANLLIRSSFTRQHLVEKCGPF